MKTPFSLFPEFFIFSIAWYTKRQNRKLIKNPIQTFKENGFTKFQYFP